MPPKRPLASDSKVFKKKKDKPTSTSGPYTPLQLPLKDDMKVNYTKAQLESFYDLRVRRYEDLLHCARTNAPHCLLLMPDPGVYAISMARTCYTLRVKLELVDIFHYLQKHLTKPLVKDKTRMKSTITYRNFGLNMGIDIAHSTMYDYIRNEKTIRKQADQLPLDAKYMINRKNRMVEEVLFLWLQDQRSRQIPINGKMVMEAAQVTYTVLVDEYEKSDTRDAVVPSFSASWFNAFKKRYQISYSQLYGEAGGVDLVAIEPELRDIRAVCVNYSPDDIFNCDETGVYLKELVTKSYTIPEKTSGSKPNRSARVSILFCVNASGSSLVLSEDPKMSALRPLLIAKSMAREVDEEAKGRMEIRRNGSGWMNSNIFMSWLIDLDKQLQRPTLLLMDSCPAHNKVEKPDPDFNYRDNWKFLTIQRLPKNSTSITQPLDAGIISVFKRALLDLLSRETSLVKTYDKSKAISNGHAWSLVPFAWNKVKASTVRNCFAKTPVLPDDMRQQLRQRPTAPQEQREKIQYLRRNDYREEAQAYFEHLIVEVNEANDWKWTFKPQGTKDVQDLADESLAAEPAVKEVAIELNLLPVSSPSCPRPYDTDERASSPLAEDVYARGMQVLKERAPALGLMSVDEFKATRRVLSGGSAEEVKLSKVLKDVLRSYDKADHLGGPVEQLEVQPVIQPLLSTLMDSETLNLCPTNSSKTQYSLDDGSNNGGYVMDGNQCGQGENEGSEESDEEVDEEKQWVEKELFERQRQGYGDEEEEEEDEELLLHRDRGAAIAPFAVEEEPTADYSNYSGHAGDESNSDSDHDKSNNTISITTTAATVANNIPINEYHSFS